MFRGHVAFCNRIILKNVRGWLLPRCAAHCPAGCVKTIQCWCHFGWEACLDRQTVGIPWAGDTSSRNFDRTSPTHAWSTYPWKPPTVPWPFILAKLRCSTCGHKCTTPSTPARACSGHNKPATPSTPARACSSHKPATPSTPARACAQSPSQRYAAKARPKYFDKHACISNPPCQAAFACDPRDIQSRSRSSHLDIPWSRPWSLSIRLIKRYTHRTRRFWWVRFPSSAAATEQTGSLLLAASPLLHPESQWHFEVQPGSHEVVAHSRREFPGLELFFFISGVRKYAMGMSQNRRPETFSCNYKTKFRDPLFWDIPL